MHQAADTDLIENVTLMHCPPERQVRVNVPLVVRGEELCPGLKAGGRINWIKRTIPVLARGDGIPAAFEVDISQLEKNDKLLFTDLRVPAGVKLLEKVRRRALWSGGREVPSWAAWWPRAPSASRAVRLTCLPSACLLPSCAGPAATSDQDPEEVEKIAWRRCPGLATSAPVL